MNAYELADYVSDNGYIGTDTTHEVATMLRQQADRIAELEKDLKGTKFALHVSENIIVAKNQTIAELERTLSIMEGEYPEPTIFAKITEFNSLEEAYNRIAELEKEKWLTEIEAKRQSLKQIIDWLKIEHDTLACSSYPMSKKNRAIIKEITE